MSGHRGQGWGIQAVTWIYLITKTNLRTILFTVVNERFNFMLISWKYIVTTGTKIELLSLWIKWILLLHWASLCGGCIKSVRVGKWLHATLEETCLLEIWYKDVGTSHEEPVCNALSRLIAQASSGGNQCSSLGWTGLLRGIQCLQPPQAGNNFEPGPRRSVAKVAKSFKSP